MKLINRYKMAAILALCFIVTELVLITYADRPAAIYFNELREMHPELIYYFRLYSDIGLGIWYYIIAGLALIAIGVLSVRQDKLSPIFVDKIRDYKIKIFFFLFSFSIEGILCTFIKKFTGRPRPNTFLNEHIFGLNGFSYYKDWDSLPSGHTANAFAVAEFLGTLYPRLRPWLYAMAGSIGISRIICGKHYPSDVLAGALIGILAVKLLKGMFIKPSASAIDR